MIRMLSGLIAPAVVGLGRLFKIDGKVSAHRIAIAVTLVVVGFGLWSGWVQWVLLGKGVAADGIGGAGGVFFARWATSVWLVLLLCPAVKVSGLLDFCVPMSLLVCATVTFFQAACVHDLFAQRPRMHYSTTVSCTHCSKSCWAKVQIGKSWTDWEYVECCGCGIKVSPERVPEYVEVRKAWDARVQDRGDDGAQD